MDNIKLSVIIPTANRGELLTETIFSIKKQSIDMNLFEILVIDNCSKDDTKDLVFSMKNNFPNLYYFYESNPGLHYARHRGLREAKGEILIFIDDDIEVQPDWLLNINQIFLDKDVALCGGNCLPLFLEEPPIWLKTIWNKKDIYGTQILSCLSIQKRAEGRYEINPSFIWGCNFSVRKNVVINAGGFNPDGMPPDRIRFRGDGEKRIADYIKKYSLKCIFDSKVSIFHKVTKERMQLKYFEKRGFREGISDSFTDIRLKKKKLLIKLYILFFLKELLRICFSLGQKRKIDLANSKYNFGYINGYRFHQHKYNNDPKVKAWVEKSNFFKVID